MKSIIHEIIPLLEALPTQGKEKIYEEIQKIMLEWDPDFINLTPQEEKEYIEAQLSDYTEKFDFNF